jgi:hypothetical protein
MLVTRSLNRANARGAHQGVEGGGAECGRELGGACEELASRAPGFLRRVGGGAAGGWVRRGRARRARALARRRSEHGCESAEGGGGRIRRRIARGGDQATQRRRQVAPARQVRAQRCGCGGTERGVACAQSGVQAGRRAQRSSRSAGREARSKAEKREAVLCGLRLFLMRENESSEKCGDAVCAAGATGRASETMTATAATASASHSASARAGA